MISVNVKITRILYVIITLILFACSSSKMNPKYYADLMNGNFIDNQKVDFKIQESQSRKFTKEYQIIDLKINGQNIIMDLQYKKSCKNDDHFELLALPSQNDTYPNKRIIQLVVNSSDNQCNYLSYLTLNINVGHLFMNEVDLIIDGWRQRPVTYIPPYSN